MIAGGSDGPLVWLNRDLSMKATAFWFTGLAQRL
jgi:hypothetical protein